jgi:putative ATPase
LISAVLSGIKEIRNVVAMAKQVATQGRKTILFVDEVHRFNKGQQDAFLPHVEDGTVILIGATTENPSFELNNALLSRARVYRLQSIDEEALLTLLERALPRIGDSGFKAETKALKAIASSAQGDARLALNLLEIAADSTQDGSILLDQLGPIRR